MSACPKCGQSWAGEPPADRCPACGHGWVSLAEEHKEPSLTPTGLYSGPRTASSSPAIEPASPPPDLVGVTDPTEEVYAPTPTATDLDRPSLTAPTEPDLAAARFLAGAASSSLGVGGDQGARKEDALPLGVTLPPEPIVSPLDQDPTLPVELSDQPTAGVADDAAEVDRGADPRATADPQISPDAETAKVLSIDPPAEGVGETPAVFDWRPSDEDPATMPPSVQPTPSFWSRLALLILWLAALAAAAVAVTLFVV
jgi:hypothetical protein